MRLPREGKRKAQHSFGRKKGKAGIGRGKRIPGIDVKHLQNRKQKGGKQEWGGTSRIPKSLKKSCLEKGPWGGKGRRQFHGEKKMKAITNFEKGPSSQEGKKEKMCLPYKGITSTAN